MKSISMMKDYLFWLSETRTGFARAELLALFTLFDHPMTLPNDFDDLPYVIVTSSNEDKLMQIAQRSVCTKFVIHLWTHSKSHSELCTKLKECQWCLDPMNCDESRAFRFTVFCFGKKVSQSMKTDKIEQLSFLPFRGPIRLEGADNIFFYVENYGRHPEKAPEDPLEIFFGKWLCDGNRRAMNFLSLKSRKFISNTSMDPLFALIMANLALVKDGDIVLDPFVGSGSLLVASAYFGARVFGSDIDYLLLHGKTKPTRADVKKREPEECIRTNFKQYEMEEKYLDILVADTSKPLWRKFEFDAIITDPPYGIRENSQKIGTMKADVKIPEELLAAHIPSKVHYSLGNIVDDLFELGLTNLKIGGRLVFWFPKSRNESHEGSLPIHSSFKLLSYSVQQLAQNVDRILVCYELVQIDTKIDPFIPKAVKQFRQTYLTSLGKECKVKCQEDSA